jgi:hypothetical protein
MKRLAAAIGALALCAPALAEGPVLQHDPFARPAIAGFAAARPAAAFAPAPAAASVQAGPRLKLNAVLAAGSDSIANVDGVMVRIGESVQGYRLVAVSDRSAVFEKNNAKVTLTLRGAGKGEGAPRMKTDDAQ